MSPEDVARLSWYEDFRLHFAPGHFPRVGSPLLGARFELMQRDKDGNLVKWDAT